MLRCWPNFAINLDGKWREVRKTAEFFRNTVEIYDLCHAVTPHDDFGRVVAAYRHSM
jgi:hypothetical protein